MHTSIRFARTAAFLAIGVGPAIAADYTFTLVDAFNPEYSLRECYIYDINDQGVACGAATIRIGSTTTYTGFYWSQDAGKTPASISWPRGISNPGLIAGVMSVFDIPSGQSTTVPLLPSTYAPLVLLAVNDAGVAGGYVQTCNCSNSQGVLQIPYVWDAVGGARSVAVPGAKGIARINSAGTAIGWTGGNSSADGFFVDLESGAYTMLSDVFPPEIGFGPTRASDINDAGVIVGTRSGSFPVYFYGYVYSPSTGVQVLPFLGEPYQQAVKPMGINNAGTVVGEIYQGGSARAFVYTPANGIRDLNDPAIVAGIPAGFTLMNAQKVNDTGWIVGWGYGGGGMYKSFVLRPNSAGDVDGDGDVDLSDLTLLLGSFGLCNGDAGYNMGADFDASGCVELSDLAVLLGTFGI